MTPSTPIAIEEITNPGPDVTALVADCECDACDPEECSCPHAVWYLRHEKTIDTSTGEAFFEHMTKYQPLKDEGEAALLDLLDRSVDRKKRQGVIPSTHFRDCVAELIVDGDPADWLPTWSDAPRLDLATIVEPPARDIVRINGSLPTVRQTFEWVESTPRDRPLRAGDRVTLATKGQMNRGDGDGVYEYEVPFATATVTDIDKRGLTVAPYWLVTVTVEEAP